MKRNMTLAIVAGVLLLVVAGITLAAGLDLSIDWWTADGGGGGYAGGGYSLQGTVGQPEAGEAAGGGYSLSSGYWGGPFTEPETPIQSKIFVPMVVG